MYGINECMHKYDQNNCNTVTLKGRSNDLNTIFYENSARIILQNFAYLKITCLSGDVKSSKCMLTLGFFQKTFGINLCLSVLKSVHSKI